MKNCKEFVRLGFNDCSINFATRTLSIREAIDIVRSVEQYNEFYGEKVANALKKVEKIWENSYQLSCEFGREGSPVLYIDIPYFKKTGVKYTEQERNERIELTIAVMKADTETDELWADESKYKIRCWWD